MISAETRQYVLYITRRTLSGFIHNCVHVLTLHCSAANGRVSRRLSGHRRCITESDDGMEVWSLLLLAVENRWLAQNGRTFVPLHKVHVRVAHTCRLCCMVQNKESIRMRAGHCVIKQTDKCSISHHFLLSSPTNTLALSVGDHATLWATGSRRWQVCKDADTNTIADQ